MEKFLTKYFWIFNILIVTAIAYLLAAGVGELVASKIEAMLPKVEAPKKATKSRPKPVTHRVATAPTGDAILSRNIFDSATGPISRFPEVEATDNATQEEAVNVDGLPIVPCSMGNIRVISTVASRDDSAWSFATVDTGGGNVRMYRSGDELDGRTVSGVTWRYLFLRGNTDECYIDLFPDPGAAPPPSSHRLTAAPSPAASTLNKGDSRIQKVSDNEAVVERSLINELLANPTNFVRSVRVRPQREGGKIVGYKLRRFQSNSPLAALGAQKGDVIRAVNGVDLTSMDKALGAFQSLRNANDLTFSIDRAGKPMDMKISIR